MKLIHEIPPMDRPVQKLVKKGPRNLSDIELVSNIIKSGMKQQDVRQISTRIVRTLKDVELSFLSLEDLTRIEGVGKSRACQILSAMEMARRYLIKDEHIIQNPKDVLNLLQDLKHKQQEYFVCISLNGANEVIKKRVVTIGLLNSSQVHPREVFADVIADRGASVVLAHNHPSGSLSPSESDIQITNQLVEAGNILGITVLDHIIISKKGHTSLKEQGFM